MDIYYYFFFLCTLIALFSKLNKEITCIILAILLILFAGTRLDIDSDYAMYKEFFRFLGGKSIGYLKREYPTVELSIYIIPNFFKLFFYKSTDIIQASFLTMAIIAITLKMASIYKYAHFFILSFVFYLSSLFFMHEMTTIRAGISAGIFLLSIDDVEKKNTKGFLMKSAVALFFHYSSILFVFCYFILIYLDNIKYYYYGIVVSFIAVITKINILKLLFLDRLIPKVKVYMEMMEKTQEVKLNIFNFKIIFSVFILLVMGYHYRKLSEIKYFQILFKIHIISLIIFWALSPTVMVFSVRSFELLSVVQIILAPMLLYVFTPKYRVVAVLIISLFILIQLYYGISIQENFKPYKSWL